MFTRYIVDVYAPGIEAVSISGAARFAGMDKITASSFRLNISGYGKIEGSFECSDFSARISGSGEIDSNIVCKSLQIGVSGSGKITLSGQCNEMEIGISGSGDIIAREFPVNNANVRISGYGNVNIWVLDNLQANASGSGRIKYRGSPKIDYKSSGSVRLESD